MIDLLNHLRIDSPTLATTEITFYGTFGYFMFVFILVLATITVWKFFRFAVNYTPKQSIGGKKQ